MAELDVVATLAERAVTLDWSAPELTDEAGIAIERGRHPVVEKVRDEPFEPNDLGLDDSRRMLVITGPNMGGKSTYMRQNALIVLLAHIGSYVPASRAVIGPIDRVFTRIGAGDDLSRGQSTFMVEMSETANILPTQPILVTVDTRLAERAGFQPSDIALRKAADRNIEVPRYRKFLAKLVPPMLEKAESIAGERAKGSIDAAVADATATLDAELSRLLALRTVNPAISSRRCCMAGERPMIRPSRESRFRPRAWPDATPG